MVLDVRGGSSQSADDAKPPSAARRARGRESDLREDIQGLRVVAVMSVVLFHLWPNRLTGGYVGVDVFFVISGFLITSHLVNRPPTTGRLLATFWARRIRRLLPASLLVLAVTLVASRLVAPETTWAATSREIMASALYVENWSLAAKAVDYLGADAAPTPVQHFWSLSTEEQFYLVWPVLVGALVLVHMALSRRRGGDPLAVRHSTGGRPPAPVSQRTVLGLGLGAVVLGSLAYSVHLTRVDPARAYFVTPTRAWEFGLGGLVALLPAAVLGGRALSRVAAWVGLAMIGVSAVWFTASTPFPGYAALLPVLGTGLVIAARADGPGSPGPLWRLPGAQWVGDASYSIYLWHWPLIVLLPAVSGGSLGRLDKAAILVATFVLSAVTKKYVEDRFRFPARGRPTLASSYRLAAVGMTTVLVLGGAAHQEAAWRADRAREAIAAKLAGADPCFGAGAAVRGPRECPPDPEAPLVPELSVAGDDKSDAYADNCFANAPYDGRRTCTYGDGPVKVALVGNSHAGHWLPALQRIAKERGWTITTYLVSLCNVSTVRPKLANSTQADNCQSYGRWVYDRTTKGGYDLVISSERQSLLVQGTDWAGTARASEQAYRGYIDGWVKSGADVVVLKDNMVPPISMGRIPDCIAANESDRSACTWPLDRTFPADPAAYRWSDPLYAAARAVGGPRVRTVSVDDLLCPQGTCQPVVGGVVTLFDASHYTATFAATMAPIVSERMGDLPG